MRPGIVIKTGRALRTVGAGVCPPCAGHVDKAAKQMGGRSMRMIQKAPTADPTSKKKRQRGTGSPATSTQKIDPTTGGSGPSDPLRPIRVPIPTKTAQPGPANRASTARSGVLAWQGVDSSQCQLRPARPLGLSAPRRPLSSLFQLLAPTRARESQSCVAVWIERRNRSDNVEPRPTPQIDDPRRKENKRGSPNNTTTTTTRWPVSKRPVAAHPSSLLGSPFSSRHPTAILVTSGSARFLEARAPLLLLIKAKHAPCESMPH